MNRFFILALFSLMFNSPLFAATVVVKTGDGGNYFSPAHVTINVGDTIKWVWIAGHHNTSSYSIPTGATAWYSNLDSSTPEFYIVPLVSGMYRYTCTHHSGMDGSFFVRGCSFPEQPLISLSWNKDPCSGGVKALLRTKPQAGASYQWLKDASLLSGATADSLSVSVSGSYKVLVNRCGEDSIAHPYFIPAYPLPPASFSYAASSLIFSFTNTTSSISGYSFSWNFGDGSPEVSDIHPMHPYSSAGKYDVRLTIKDSAGLCIDSTIQTLNALLSIDKIFYDKDVHIFPNPATDDVNIISSSVFRVELKDLFGQTLLQRSCYQSEHHFNIQSIVPGIYLLCLYNSVGSRFVHHIRIQ